MAKEFLGDRKKALEESFFAKENARLLERMRAEAQNKETRESLRRVTGIASDDVLDKLCELGVSAETWAAVSIAPLVEVAWADGKVEDGERKAVLAGAQANGIAEGSASHELLSSWLERRPDGRLLEVWGAFIVGVCAEMNDFERNALKNQVLGLARNVAKSAGGFLGLGNKVSPEEDVVLEELERAFDA